MFAQHVTERRGRKLLSSDWRNRLVPGIYDHSCGETLSAVCLTGQLQGTLSAVMESSVQKASAGKHQFGDRHIY
jgi:hypothetical protein